MSGKKIPPELENPIDNISSDLAECLSPYFKKLNFTPNTLTTISMFFGIMTIYYYTQKRYIHSAIFYFIARLFDCFDGYYARKYNMVSKFGSMYDSIKDTVISTIMFFLIYNKYKTLKDWRYFLQFGWLLLIIPGIMHMGCQEKYYDKQEESKILSYYSNFCPKNNKKDIYNIMRITRFVNLPTMTLYLLFLILYSYIVDKG